MESPSLQAPAPEGNAAGVTPARPGAVRLEWDSLRRALGIFRYVRPYRARFWSAVCALLLSTVVGLSFPYLTGLLLDASVGMTGGGGWMQDINAIAGVLVVSLALQAGLSFFSTYWFSRSGESALVDVRKDLFSRLVNLPMTFHARRRVGELTSRLSSDLTVIQETLTGSVPQFIRQCTLLGGGILLVGLTSLRLTGLMLVTFPLLILVAILIGRKIRRHSREGQDRLADGNTVLEESLQGIGNVKAFGNEEYEMARYGGFLSDYLRVIVRASRLRATLISFIIFGVFGSIVAVFWFGAVLMQQGQLTFGELTRFILYTTFVGGSVASFADLFAHIQRTIGATDRVWELLAEEPEIPAADRRAGGERFRGAVRFDGVGFHYPSRAGVPVLQNIRLEAKPGQKIALVGPSGAGKSTLVSLLLRFYEPTAGALWIDGRPAAKIPLPVLRGNMAIVPQEVILFGGTIAENIRYGKPGASHDELLAASRGALCHDFITAFPDGYDTIVGERGVQLSGGQRQRVAIARALLRDPSILILDEATSSLDSESESLIQRAIHTLLAGRTAFIIAHRLSTVREADCIYVIEAGAVTEAGTHDELMAYADGKYRRLAEMQFGTGEQS